MVGYQRITSAGVVQGWSAGGVQGFTRKGLVQLQLSEILDRRRTPGVDVTEQVRCALRTTPLGLG